MFLNEYQLDSRRFIKRMYIIFTRKPSRWTSSFNTLSGVIFSLYLCGIYAIRLIDSIAFNSSSKVFRLPMFSGLIYSFSGSSFLGNDKPPNSPAIIFLVLATIKASVSAKNFCGNVWIKSLIFLFSFSCHDIKSF